MLGAMRNFVKATKLIDRIPKIEQKLDLLLWETPDIPRDFFPKLIESARQMGWLESAKQHKPMTADGEPCPWYTYPMLHFLGTRHLGGLRVFEYGSGNSTLWWSRKATSVVSVEHDRAWFEMISRKTPDNVAYVYRELVPGGDYSTEVTRHQGAPFDVVVIDGRDRVNCARATMNLKARPSAIIWDNSERERYQEGYDLLTNSGYRRIDFDGFGPVNGRPWRTSVFYTPDNCLKI
ncbi:hypothetical protein [Sinorhizobium alkalisoli]|uniref:FkbM family methyltransferase n=1 Tax=Sinorhizobium alkalisoli TaxID=1752398 RepID=A0A1E3VFT9_9HYPH|nr:hypothetical protein [Sinorhizobium alkalisoli]ODR92453.1 hypothetical protein A8M32_05330 [Sinorhizobium alkalisoli]